MTRHRELTFAIHMLAGLGFTLMISPFFLYWLIHGNHDRYIWIISGPYPFSSFGSGPFQIFMFAGLFLLGLILTSISWSLFNKS